MTTTSWITAFPVVVAAYARSARNAVIHEVVVTDWRRLDARTASGLGRLEAWYHPADGRARRLYDLGGDRIDIVVPAHGPLRLRNSYVGPDWTVNPAPGLRRTNQTDFLHEFRRAYETGRLEQVGERPFDGRPAMAYRVKSPAGIDEELWYVDPTTARPLGSTRRFDHVAGGQLLTRRLVEYERLSATAAHLRLLDPPTGAIQPSAGRRQIHTDGR